MCAVPQRDSFANVSEFPAYSLHHRKVLRFETTAQSVKKDTLAICHAHVHVVMLVKSAVYYPHRSAGEGMFELRIKGKPRIFLKV